MKNVALYIRVSTAEQAVHGLSLGAQKDALEAWAKKSGLNVVGVYADEGISARKPASKRPALQRLLEDVRAGKVELIAFTKLDRWFRSVGEYYKVQEILEKHHVDWLTIQEDYDTSTASGRLKINIMLSVAQDEADRTSERIKSINESKRQKGEALTGQCPFGYKLDGKRVVKDPALEAAVNVFFQTFLDTSSTHQSMDAAFEKCGVTITYPQAYKMIKSTAYYGRYWKIDNMCPPYITREQYEQIQQNRLKWARKTKNNRVYIFTGLVFCGACGHRMVGRRNGKRECSNYQCPRKDMNGGCDNHACPGERKIERLLLDSLETRFKASKLEAEKRWAESQEKSYEHEISALKSKLGRLKDLYLNELITLEEYKRDKADMEDRISKLEQLSKPLEKPDFSVFEEMLTFGWRGVYEDASKENKRKFWRMLIRRITVYPDRHIEYELKL